MSKIKTITELRELALETLENLRDNKIELAEAVATGKLCDNVINTVKAELEYHRMIGETPKIPFMMGYKVIESKPMKEIENKKGR